MALATTKQRMNTYELAKSLLWEYILHSIHDGRNKVNVRDANSPIAISISGFRRFVWEVSRGDSTLKPYVVRLSSKSREADLVGGKRLTPTAHAWVNYAKRYLEKLRRRGLIEDYWKTGRKYFIRPTKKQG